MKALKLLKVRRFSPFFCVQFLGAFNDNLFKTALVMIIAFKTASESESGILINLASGLFILPFFLFSAAAGQIADKFEKSKLIRIIKIAEIVIMAIGALGFYLENVALLFVTLFLMGAQSAFFGPAKYSLIPQHLKDEELVAGNGLVEMGTFLAILLGTIAGGILSDTHTDYIIASVLIVALMGWVISREIPYTPAGDPELALNLNPLTQTMSLCRNVMSQKTIFLSILGISWFWYFGATILAQLPSYSKFFLYSDKQVVTLLLATFSLSIGVGSILCEKLSGDEIEIGLVPFGAIGMSLFCGDLFFINYPPLSGSFLSIAEFMSGQGGMPSGRVLFDVFGIGFFGSFFIVPLYSLIQYRSNDQERSRVIAANNVFNAVFMIFSALVTMLLYQLGYKTVDVFLFIALANTVVSLYIFSVIPEFTMRFFVWILACTIYRIRLPGIGSIPKRGAAILVCNHVSFIDWFIVTAACRRPVRFIVYHKFYFFPLLNPIFRLAKAIPIAPAKESDSVKKAAFKEISLALKNGDLVGIFPEGLISHDGKLNHFRKGIERILDETPVPVIPMAINGLWGSFFSRKGGAAMKKVPAPRRRKIDVVVGEIMTRDVTAESLRFAVQKISGQQFGDA